MTLRMSPGRRSAEKRWTIPEMLTAATTESGGVAHGRAQRAGVKGHVFPAHRIATLADLAAVPLQFVARHQGILGHPAHVPFHHVVPAVVGQMGKEHPLGGATVEGGALARLQVEHADLVAAIETAHAEGLVPIRNHEKGGLARLLGHAGQQGIALFDQFHALGYDAPQAIGLQPQAVMGSALVELHHLGALRGCSATGGWCSC